MAATLVPVEEYLATEYSPDVDYVDGVLEDRNVGEVDHADLQGRLYSYLFARRREFGIYPLIETRMQISGNRYRVPDVCAVVGERPSERILTRPPLLCIEVLSPEDRMVRVQEKIADFLRSGVRFVWVVNPETLSATVYTASGISQVTDGVLRTTEPDIAVPLAEL